MLDDTGINSGLLQSTSFVRFPEVSTLRAVASTDSTFGDEEGQDTSPKISPEAATNATSGAEKFDSLWYLSALFATTLFRLKTPQLIDITEIDPT